MAASTPATVEVIVQPPAPDANAEVDIDSSGTDTDSAYDSGSSTHGSASLTSSIYGYRYENGRRYHAYRDGKYLLPNDEAEQDRLDLHHHIFCLVLGGRLFRAPISADPQRVLDFGTGSTGIWAVDFADAFPSALVIGTDLSPIQPDLVPTNLRFYVDDVESEWVYPPNEAFDFIHARGMGGSISDFDQLYRQAYANMKPGGWIEMQEYEGWISSDEDPTLSRAPYTAKWQEVMDEASRKFGKRLNIAKEQKDNLIKAGFVNVRDDIYKVPIRNWAKDPKLKVIGSYQLEHMILCLEAFSVALLTRVMGWEAEEVTVLLARVRNEFLDKKNHLLTIFHFVYGQRPYEDAQVSSTT